MSLLKTRSEQVFVWTTLESTEAATAINQWDNRVTSITISAGWTGYAAGTLVFSAPSAWGTPAKWRYTVDWSWIINAYVITDQGSGYTTAPTVTPSHAGNADATLVAVVTANTIDIDCENESKLSISATYTTGSGETSNACDLTVYWYDGSSWRKLSTTSVTWWVATSTPTIFRIAWASSATAYDAVFDTTVNFKKIRLAALETWVASAKGTLTASLLLS